MKRRVLFIDRDGTIIREPADEQIDSFEKLSFLPGVITQLAALRGQTDFLLVMVTNQDGLGTDTFPESCFWPVHRKMLEILADEGVTFDEICIDRTRPEDGAETRKPGTGMLTHYVKGDYDLPGSFVIGDRASDVELARNLGARAIYLGQPAHPHAELSSPHWSVIGPYLRGLSRNATIRRVTNETTISVTVNLDGSGAASVDTGIGFFDHMLEQIAHHGAIDLTLSARGDLHVDTHHTIEDTALALGAAFDQALGQRKGIDRYGFVLPMDDALATVALDFGGRPWLVWDAEFRRESIGQMPTEMFSHFFKSLSDAARCTIHIQATGVNEHHKIESIFKGFGRALRAGVARAGAAGVPSTKGVI